MARLLNRRGPMLRPRLLLSITFVLAAAVTFGTPAATAQSRAPATRVASYTLRVDAPVAEVYRTAETTPLRRFFPWPWRVPSAKPSETLRLGDRIVASYAPLRLFGVPVPVRVTRMTPGREIAYRYLEGGVSRGDNVLRFAASPDGAATLVTHESRYQITHPILRLLPFVYERIHRGFVTGLIRRLARASGATR